MVIQDGLKPTQMSILTTSNHALEGDKLLALGLPFGWTSVGCEPTLVG